MIFNLPKLTTHHTSTCCVILHNLTSTFNEDTRSYLSDNYDDYLDKIQQVSKHHNNASVGIAVHGNDAAPNHEW